MMNDSTSRNRQSKALRNRKQPREKNPARPVRRQVTDASERTSSSIPDSLSESTASPASYSYTESVSVPGATPEARSEKRRPRLPIIPLFLLLLVLGGAIWKICHTPERTPDRVELEVRYLVPGQEDITESVFYGDSVILHEPVDRDGYTFFGWKDADGNIETRESFPVYRNLVYTAEYMPIFETKKHLPYLTTDGRAVLDVDGPVTVREFVNILYLLLDRDLEGNGRFVDVPADDDCYAAAAVLKDLGILTGSRLHPDNRLTYGEMIETLARFYPAVEKDCVFRDLEADNPYYPSFCTAAALGWISEGKTVRTHALRNVTRGRFAQIMNHVLHRDSERHLQVSDIGTIMDVPPSNEYYDDLVEAIIPHEYRMQGSEELWTSSEALPVHEPGFFLVGFRMHFIDSDGVPAVNDTVGGLTYNENGEIISGDEELDEALISILMDTIDPKGMDRLEMLRAVYNYVVHNFDYRYGNMYPYGAEGWDIREAKRMLENKGGNCYCFSGLFYHLARFLGYDAKIFSGRIRGEQYEYLSYDQELVFAPMGMTPHSWVEIEFDGYPYIFDPEMEYRNWGLKDMFMGDESLREQYSYTKAEEE